MNETTTGSGQRSTKKHKTSVPVPPDKFVVDRIKGLKKTIGGVKCEDSKWTEMLREKLDQGTVKDKFTGDRSFKTNQTWVSPTPTGTRGGPPKWSWFGVLFMLTPFGILSERQEYQLSWVCLTLG